MWCDIVVAYSFENLLKIQVQITCKSDNAKWVLKHSSHVFLKLSSHAQYFGSPAFAKSAISGLALPRAKYKRRSGEESKNPNNLKVTVLKHFSRNLLPDKFLENRFFFLSCIGIGDLYSKSLLIIWIPCELVNENFVSFTY